MVAYGAGARWYKKKEFVREYFVQKFVSYKKHFFLQKETFIKNIFQKTNDKKR